MRFGINSKPTCITSWLDCWMFPPLQQRSIVCLTHKGDVLSCFINIETIFMRMGSKQELNIWNLWMNLELWDIKFWCLFDVLPPHLIYLTCNVPKITYNKVPDLWNKYFHLFLSYSIKRDSVLKLWSHISLEEEDILVHTALLQCLSCYFNPNQITIISSSIEE